MSASVSEAASGSIVDNLLSSMTGRTATGIGRAGTEAAGTPAGFGNGCACGAGQVVATAVTLMSAATAATVGQ